MASMKADRFNQLWNLGRSGVRAAFASAIFAACLSALPAKAADRHPRIVNIYNFVRENDYRLQNAEDVLFDATRQQIALLKQAGLPATFALQHDALVNPKYQRLFHEEAATNFEIGAWWEITESLARKAGLAWRGHHEWDPAANVGFSPGYTPDERRKLVDAYMADFKAAFGRYPQSVGSWYLDEVTLAYMGERYGAIASCNCKDQIGTDFYTLWGGYWNQAYYPSRVNAYMPAQTRAGQIDIPVFRMLGSDPIYQHGTTPGLISLEPVYSSGGGGGSADWVSWFMDNLIHQPCLAFGYTQAGQENSFGWNAMKKGLTQQIALFAEEAKTGAIQVETLAQAGQWFRAQFPLTPSTAVVALDDWKHQGRKTVWYDSRFYRLNLLWENNTFFIRDLHCFDERLVSPTHTTPLTATSLVYGALPIMDWAMWSKQSSESVGAWPVLIGANDAASPMPAAGPPAVKELNATDLSIEQPLAGGGSFQVICSEGKVAFAGVDGHNQPLRWTLRFVGGAGQKAAVQSVSPHQVKYKSEGCAYEMRVPPGSGSAAQLENGEIRIQPNAAGKLVLLLSPAASRN